MYLFKRFNDIFIKITYDFVSPENENEYIIDKCEVGKN